MLFQPTLSFEYIKDADYSKQILDIEQTLQQYQVCGSITSFDGCRLNYNLYSVENAHATIIIVHGLSEFYKKYYEFTWYFLNMGYNVVLYDQRGHGLSGRDIDGLSLLHVNHFEDYAKDLDVMIKELVKPTYPELPIYLFSHSMGGAVAGLYLALDSSTVKKAVLSSPMICPAAMNVPIPIVKMATLFSAVTHGWNAKFPYSNDFDPNVKLEHSADYSYARFRHNLDYRIHTPEYQTSATTNRWMWEALHLQKKLLSNKYAKMIQCNILLFNAGQDITVKQKPQEAFAKKLKNCTYYSFEHSKHTIYTGSDNTICEFYHKLFDFYE